MVDECVHSSLVVALQSQGCDVVRPPKSGKPDSTKDPEVLLISARENRLLITSDTHIVEHLEAHVARGHEHPGLIVTFNQWPSGALIKNVLHTLKSYPPAQLRNTYTWAFGPSKAGD